MGLPGEAERARADAGLMSWSVRDASGSSAPGQNIEPCILDSLGTTKDLQCVLRVRATHARSVLVLNISSALAAGLLQVVDSESNNA